MVSPANHRPAAPVRYSVREVALAYKVSMSTVRSWVANGELIALNLASRRATRPRLVIPAEALSKFDAARQASPRVDGRRRRPVEASPAPTKDYFA